MTIFEILKHYCFAMKSSQSSTSYDRTHSILRLKSFFIHLIGPRLFKLLGASELNSTIYL